MARYIISVHEIIPSPLARTATEVNIDVAESTQEVFKLGVEEFDPLALVAALNKKPRKPRRITTAPTGK